MLKKNIIGSFVSAFIIISSIQTVQGLEKGIVRQCDYLNIRKGPSVKYGVVSKLYTSNVIDIVEKSGNWYKIKNSSNVEGWVSSKYIGVYTQVSQNTDTNKTEVVNNNANNDTNNIYNTNSKIDNILKLANAQIGKPYRWGATGPNSFDCSGFTSYVYKNGAGISLPRTSVNQSRTGTKISKNNLKTGDLVFFNTSGRGVSHVGIYIGDSKFIHSSSSKGITISNLNSTYYRNKFISGSRIIP